VRPEQSRYDNWKFHSLTGIGCEQLLADCHVQHTPKNSILLVYGGRFCGSLFPVSTTFDPDPNSLLYAITQILFDCVSCDFHEFLTDELSL